MGAVDPAGLRAELLDQVAAAEISAAHEREFIPSGAVINATTVRALRAAVLSGVAIGLRQALEAIDALEFD